MKPFNWNRGYFGHAQSSILPKLHRSSCRNSQRSQQALADFRTRLCHCLCKLNCRELFLVWVRFTILGQETIAALETRSPSDA